MIKGGTIMASKYNCSNTEHYFIVKKIMTSNCRTGCSKCAIHTQRVKSGGDDNCSTYEMENPEACIKVMQGWANENLKLVTFKDKLLELFPNTKLSNSTGMSGFCVNAIMRSDTKPCNINNHMECVKCWTSEYVI